MRADAPIPRWLSPSECRSRTSYTSNAMLCKSLLLLVVALCTALTPTVTAHELTVTPGPRYPVGAPGEQWTATCIASGSAVEDVSLIGGYVIHTVNNTADFKVIKSDATNGKVLWTRTIQPENGTANMVLGCASDWWGDLYVATASNSSKFDGVTSSHEYDTYSLFLSKIKVADGAFAWTMALNHTNNIGVDADLLDVAWDLGGDRVVLFGQMYSRDGSGRKEARLMRFDSTNGNLLTNITVGTNLTTAFASALAVDASGQVYAAYSSFESQYDIPKTCISTNCTSCFVTKFATNDSILWTKVTSYLRFCTGAELALDRITDNLAVYMNAAENNVFYSNFTAIGTPIQYPPMFNFFDLRLSNGKTGSIFVHGGEILRSHIFRQSDSQWTSSALVLGSSSLFSNFSSNATLERRISRMAWSANSSKVMHLTRTNSSGIDAPIWEVINSPAFTLPDGSKYLAPKTKSQSISSTTTVQLSGPTPVESPPVQGLPDDPVQPVLDLQLILGSVCGVLFVVIAILLLHAHVRRRQQLHRKPHDKEQQINRNLQYASNDAIARSSNMLFSRELQADAPGSPAQMQAGPSNNMHTSPSTAYVKPSQRTTHSHVRPSVGIRSETHHQFSDLEADIGLAKSASKPTFSPPGNFTSSSDAHALKSGKTAITQRSLISGALTGKSTIRSTQERFSIIQTPKPSVESGDTTLVANPSSAIALTTTTIMCDQKAMSIPGFLEVQDGVDFTLGKELARGGGGAVYLGEAFNPEIIRRAQTKQIVVKRVFGNAENPQESDNTFYQEVAIMWLLSGRNISKIVGFCSRPKSILMKFYPCGSLSDLIHFQSSKPKLASIRYDLLLTLRLATDVACGVTEIHKEGLFHSDLKPPNILLDIDEQGVLYAVITDFGVTQVVNHTTLVVKAFHVSKMAGASPCYAAPELLDRRLVPISTPSITQAADTFSFGVILVELIMRMAPWKSAKSVDDAVRGVIAGDRGYRRPLHFGGRDFHQRLVSLVERCWAQAPRVRPLMHAVHAELVEVLDKISPS